MYIGALQKWTKKEIMLMVNGEIVTQYAQYSAQVILSSTVGDDS